jgi:beta-glucanase (GH16 family)
VPGKFQPRVVAAIGVAALALTLALATVAASAAVNQGSASQGSRLGEHVPSLNGTSDTGLPQVATSAATGPWAQVLDDEFNGIAINTNVWKVYDNPTGKVHLARNVVVGGGIVSMKTRFDTALNKWSTAGMRALPAYSRTYGKYEMRVRTSAGNSRVVVLLWPDTKGVWPPEIDWMEMDGSKTDQASRQLSTQTVHYGTSSQNFMIHTKHAADMTQWHTVGLEWGPGYVRYLLDGVVTNRVVSRVVSNQIMYLGLQTSPDQTVAPNVPVNMDIDWLKIYRYDGAGMAPGGQVH